MTHTIEQISAECHRILAADPGQAGRKKLCRLLEDVLKDEAFVARYLSDDVGER